MAKAKATKNLPALGPKPGALVSWQDMLRQEADHSKEASLALPTGGGQGLGFKRGVLTVGGAPSSDNPLALVILRWVPERNYFDVAYDEANPQPPACYSFDGKRPHDDSSNKQAAACEACPQNAWESDSRQKGKACKEGVRGVVALLRDLEEQGASAPLYTFRLSVMNAMTFKAYDADVRKKAGALPAVVTSLRCEPDDRTQYRVTLRALEAVPKEVQGAIMALREKALDLATQPYPAPTERKPARRATSRMAGPRSIRRSAM